MKLFNKITIIGVGLIGGSIALAIKKRKLAGEVIGVFRHRSTMQRAMRCKAVDKGLMDIREGVKLADLIILATPVYSIPGICREVIKYSKRGAIIIDAGSTKKWVVDKAERMIRPSSSVSFVGSHPMAGSERSGVEFAKDDLMNGSPCIVTKTPRTKAAALRKVVRFWRALGAKVKVMTPGQHDRSVSLISHLPHIVAFSLAGAVPEKELIYAAEGFKDTTRVSSSDPALWSDIFLSNKKEVVKAGRLFRKFYDVMITALSKGDYSKVLKMLSMAKAKRDRLVYDKKR